MTTVNTEELPQTDPGTQEIELTTRIGSRVTTVYVRVTGRQDPDLVHKMLGDATQYLMQAD